jgi:hypothetical protein
MAPLWLEGIQMKQHAYFVNGLTDNQKTFLLSNGCTVEPYQERFNYWISKEGLKVIVKNKQAEAAWGLIQNSDLLIIPIKDYTNASSIPLSGYSAELAILDEVDTIPTVVWDKVETE